MLVLAAVGFYFSQQNKKSTITESTKAAYDFTIKDTASITKIVIKDKTPSAVTLTRGNGRWMVNNLKPARKVAMADLLETLYRMEMRNFVQEIAKDAVNKRIDVFGKEVEIYTGDQLVKHFFVGTETGDQLGTFMKMAGYPDPFAVHILGFNGYLNTRFFTSSDMWYDRTIWGFDNLEITSASVVYSQTPALSFNINMIEGLPVLTDFEGNEIPTSNEHIKHATQSFFAAFRNTKYEGAIIETDPIFSRKDSLLLGVPFVQITASALSGETHTLQAYRIKAAADTYEEDGLPSVYDPDRMHAFIDGEQFVLVQFYGLKNVMLTINDFL